MKPVSEFSKIDKAFDSAKFSSKLSNIYRRLKTTASDGKLEEMEPYLTPALFKSLSEESAALAKKGRVLYTERITVLGVEVKGFEQTADFDFMYADVRVRAVEYIADIKTHQRIKGDADEQFSTVTVKLIRESGRVSPQLSGISAQNCPYCGAPVNINKSTRCDYCGRILNTDSFDWLIDSLKVQ
ncbi:MAG: TIM44-like domain-containing protein [Clostridia bacterium]|nr:TIM44-like domain-containing protein [Clostridia bacterium]